MVCHNGPLVTLSDSLIIIFCLLFPQIMLDVCGRQLIELVGKVSPRTPVLLGLALRCTDKQTIRGLLAIVSARV